MLIGMRNGMIAGKKESSNQHLCFTAEQANSSVTMKKQGVPPAVDLRYSTDGTSWSQFIPGTTTVSLPGIGDKVWIVAGPNGNASLNYGSAGYHKFVMTGKIAASGSVMSLLDSVNEIYSVPSYGFMSLFSGCTSLTQAPALPATTLAPSCYASMFYNTSLTQAPELPAIVLAERCYFGMFYGCTSLVQAPALPATTLAYSCYYYMFYNCTSLTSIDVSFTAWNPAADATTDWLQSVASVGTFTCPTALGTDSTITRGTSNCPTGWTVVNK